MESGQWEQLNRSDGLELRPQQPLNQTCPRLLDRVADKIEGTPPTLALETVKLSYSEKTELKRWIAATGAVFSSLNIANDEREIA